ncbi:hypothetical protein [Corynebacterium durum]|nr:hypothetical protein [Corynebacterium durum]
MITLKRTCYLRRSRAWWRGDSPDVFPHLGVSRTVLLRQARRR